MIAHAYRQRGGMLVLVVAAVVLLGLLLAMAAATLSLGQVRSPSSGSQLRVLFSGETLGRMAPNMCEGYLAGGLEYRADFIAQQSRPYLLLDSGCLTTPGADAGLWADEILREMAAMGYDAVNVGEHEVGLGANELTRLQQQHSLFVSANVLQADSAEHVVQPFTVSRRGGYRSAITGVIDPQLAQGRGLQAEPVAEALARLLPRMRANAEVIIVLADLEPHQADALARDFPELHLIIHRSRNNTRLPEVVNRAVVGAIYGDRYLADTTITWETQRQLSATTTAHEMTAEWSGEDGTPPIPEGLRVQPETVDFGPIADGEQRDAQLTISNDSSGTVRLGRVLSTCGCFAVGVEEREIPAGESLELTVSLHAVALGASSNVSLYFQVEGAVEGMLMVPATADIHSPDGVSP